MIRRVLSGSAAICAVVLSVETSRATAADIVLTAAHAVDVHGHWARVTDPGTATGQALSSSDSGWQKTGSAAAAPVHYVDYTFIPQPNVGYRVWLRLRAAGDSADSDSVYVQFSKARDLNETARYRIGSKDALVVNRQRCDTCPIVGWGWQNSAYWVTQPSVLQFGAGAQTLRVQTREDGVAIDQIVLSPALYLDSAPGSADADTTIVRWTPPTAPTPLTGSPAPIPSTIAADAFDAGGAGVAYYDTTRRNSGGASRSTDVDLTRLPTGEVVVTAIAAREWLTYTIEVPVSGKYVFEVDIASASVGLLHVDVNGTNLTGPLIVPNTGGAPYFTTISKAITLVAGPQTLRVVFDTTLKNAAFARLRTRAMFTTFVVDDGENPQDAIDAAEPGDVILLEAGATFVGNFTLPAKDGSEYVTIRSSAPDGSLPAPGVRITPASAPLLPKLRSPNTMPALATQPYARHYRIELVEFQANASGAGNIIALGDGSPAQTTLAMVPHHLVLDRVYIHGDAALGQKRGIALNSAETTIINSYISEIKAVGMDSQAIAGWNGPGPYIISNNFLEAAGENVMFGGADPAIPDLVPSDIEFTRNHLSKNFAWRDSSWTVKNLFELKSAQRVLVDSNLMENNWLAAQTGYAVLLKSVNQDGAAPWSVVQKITFTNNVVRHVASAVNILGRDTRYPALMANTIVIGNNLFDDVSGAKYGGSGRFLQINGGVDIIVDHNTVVSDGSTVVVPDTNPTYGFHFTNNIVLHGLYGIKGAGTGVGNPTIAQYFPDGLFVGTLYIGGNASLYPAGNFFPASTDAVGFVDFAGGDYRLSLLSIYRGAATDGSDPGVDHAALTQAFASRQ